MLEIIRNLVDIYKYWIMLLGYQLLTLPLSFYVFAIHETNNYHRNVILFQTLKVLLLINMSKCFVSKLFFAKLNIHVTF